MSQDAFLLRRSSRNDFEVVVQGFRISDVRRSIMPLLDLSKSQLLPMNFQLTLGLPAKNPKPYCFPDVQAIAQFED
jgi:hypothetical protein